MVVTDVNNIWFRVSVVVTMRAQKHKTTRFLCRFSITSAGLALLGLT